MKNSPSRAVRLKQRSRMLVGGRSNSGNAARSRDELMAGNVQALIGYVTSARSSNTEELCIIDIPEDYNIKAIYAFGLISDNAHPLAEHIGTIGQKILQKYGFITEML